MEQQLSDVLDNILGLLLLEGSYEIEEKDEGFQVSIDTNDAGRLIGVRGESLDALQLIVNQIMSRGAKEEEFKRVVLDVSGWRKQKEEELNQKAKEWGSQVIQQKKEMELEPMSAWQRRIVHTVIGEMAGLETESIGEGRDRHIVVKVKSAKGKGKSQKEELKTGTKTEGKNKDAKDKED